MKSSDIALIILVAAVSVVASYFIGNAVLGDPYDRVEQLTYVKKVEAEVEQPDGEVFNPYNINPTTEVYVGRCNVGEVWNPNSGKEGECVKFGTVDASGTVSTDAESKPEEEPETDSDDDE